MRLSSILISASLIVTLIACDSGSDFFVADDTPAETILAEAQKQLDRGRGTKAGDYLMEIERLYPYTPEAERALILAAQAYHDDEALLESRVAAERHIQLFPGSRDSALAHYLLALSYYEGIRDVKRDQSRTFEALKALQTVIDRFPGSEYAQLSEEKFNFSLNQLAGKEMDIGRYYLARDHFAAAIGRFKAVLEEYPDNAHMPEAYHRLVETYLRLGIVDEAASVAARFYAAYPQSPWAARTRALLETGQQPNAGLSTLRQVFTGDAL